MNKGILKVLPLTDLADNQQVIVVDYDDINNQEHFLIGRVEGLYEYKLRFWKTAKNDEEKPIWITSSTDPETKELTEFEEYSINYESRLAFLRTLVIEVNNKIIPINYSDWVNTLRNKNIGDEISFEEENGLAKIK